MTKDYYKILRNNKYFFLIILITYLSCSSLFAFRTKNYNVNNGKLQSNKVKDVFFYDTSEDNISDTIYTDESGIINEKEFYIIKADE
ncbi:MAG: hypothetical protein KGY75_06540 [Candidatus Cloacimonetes bacterium]|nr:hypothetical protein [Candidatus Cloacimonadota bacterium]MBS3767758.1 hypothetical protein [Candidatus Cloacimonadota bacterium]